MGDHIWTLGSLWGWVGKSGDWPNTVTHLRDGNDWTKAVNVTLIKDYSTQFTNDNNICDILYGLFHIAS